MGESLTSTEQNINENKLEKEKLLNKLEADNELLKAKEDGMVARQENLDQEVSDLQHKIETDEMELKARIEEETYGKEKIYKLEEEKKGKENALKICNKKNI